MKARREDRSPASTPGGRSELAGWLRPAAPSALDGSYENASGARRYLLYQPGRRHLGARPLVVMLHGCDQTAEDFAAGTCMHERDKGRGCFVLYPAQERRANRMGCWNWFEAAHQQRETGEPSILADMTHDIIARYRIDKDRVYVAGLSAGGAMAAILATTYPELFAAVGIHSGLPYAAASSAMSAVIAMQRGPRQRSRARGEPGMLVPTIVFHGDQDRTVHPGNGEALIACVRSISDGGSATPACTRTIRGAAPGGRAYTRTSHYDGKGRIDAEHWVIHGSGHAWSGGAGGRSYTDPLGPDASDEMLRFFLKHPRRSRR